MDAQAIAQGASWDRDLVRRVSNATAVEARILSAQEYTSTKGANMGAALSCDGGPLANSAHDPRCAWQPPTLRPVPNQHFLLHWESFLPFALADFSSRL